MLSGYSAGLFRAFRGYCQLALTRSRLFCLVVARSFVYGVDTYETDESLVRFSDGLHAIPERHVETEEAK